MDNYNDSYGIMIVDDDAAVRATIRKIIEREGYKIAAEAGDGSEAVILAKQLKPDLVIIDNNMLKMHGIEAIKIMKAENPEMKAIMLTGAPSPSLVSECFKAGCSNFLSKPVDNNHLLRVIKNTI
jgi:YesN/AraC family two-component response regulator